ncbi:hypothetical protein EB093_02885 [bacterium]|nr:hypothetical protein [bacterium]
MGFGVAPIDGGQFVNQSNTVQPLNIQSVIQQFNEGAKVIDNEVQALNKEMMGIRNTGPETREPTGKLEGPNKNVYVPQIEEQIAAELTKENEVTRARRKKSSWETKMDELAQLEGQLGFERLEGEEKEVFSSFFDNMARIRNLRAKLKQLEEKEEQFEEEKRRRNREEVNEERKRQLDANKSQSE